MRVLRYLSALSFGLSCVAVSTAALAEAPRLKLRTGRFLASEKLSAPAALEKAARQLVVQEIPASAKADLGAATTIALTGGARIVKIPQVYRGLPVALRGVAVTFGADDAAELVSAALEDDLPGDISPQITASDAAKSAGAAAGFDMDPARAALAIWPTPDGGKLVWALSAPRLAPLPYQAVVVVDAKSGEVILKYNAVTTVNQAKMYPSNPTKSPALIDVTVPVGMGQTTLQNSLVQSQNCIDTHQLKMISFMGFPISLHV